MTRALGRDHHDIDIRGRNDGFEMNAEAVGKAKNFTLGETRFNGRLVEFRLSFIRGKNLDPVGFFSRFGGSENGEPIRLRLFGTGSGRVEADNDVIAAVAQVLRLGMALASVAENRYRLALQG